MTTPQNQNQLVSISNGCAIFEQVDYEQYEKRIDLRLAPRNIKHRLNINNREGKRTNLNRNQSLDGCKYANLRKCATCGKIQPKQNFQNYAIMLKNRLLNGLNVHCRKCQLLQRTPEDYNIDGFVTNTIEKIKFPKTHIDRILEQADSKEDSDDEDEDDTEDDDDEDEDEDNEDTDEDDTENDTEDEDDEEFDVENILSHKRINGKLMFLVKWLDYDSTHNTFEPAENLKHLDCFANYIKRHKLSVQIK